jgi:predicted metal-dependent peptidase
MSNATTKSTPIKRRKFEGKGTVNDATDKLISARIEMLIRMPFFGNMATRMALVERNDMPTASVDGRNFYFNTKFVNSLKQKELIWLFAHEVMHCALEHFIRKDGRDHQLWNIAADYAINDILERNGIGKRIEGTLYDTKYSNKCAEEIYDELLENAESISLQDLIDQIVDEHLDQSKNEDGTPKSSEQIAKEKAEMREALLSSFQSSEGAGNIPAEISRLVESITKPKVSWKDELRQALKSRVKSDYSFTIPNRKAISHGIILPSMTFDNEINISIGVDVSGSISENLISCFLGEISGIISEFNSWTINLWSFDTKVYNHKLYTSYSGEDILKHEFVGGGGTDFEANWEFMKQNEINPDMFIMFTDLCPCGGWGDESYCETLFVGYDNKNTEAPFGRTIHVSSNE